MMADDEERMTDDEMAHPPSVIRHPHTSSAQRGESAWAFLTSPTNSLR